MFAVYEQFKKDGKRFLMYWHKERFDCEVWAANHCLSMKSCQTGRAELVVVDLDAE